MPFAAIAIRISRRLLDASLLVLIVLVLATLAVARVVPAVTGGATFVVGGGSMEPTIPFGSAVIVTPVAATDIRAGDVVSLHVGEERAVFTHRIIRLIPREDGLWLETRGDANPEPDPSLVPATAVIGRLAAVIPLAGYVVAIIGSGLGIVLALSLAGVLVTGAWLLEGLEVDRRRADRRRPVAGPARRAPDVRTEPAVPG